MKIGVFDSGLGGLTILKTLQRETPGYEFIYLGDNKRAPYGPRSFEDILEFTWENVQKLFDLDCQVIVLACNTASAKALRTIQQRYLPETFPDRRVLGVIRPSAEELASHSKTGQVALWATEGTVKSDSYEIELNHQSPNLQVHQQACPDLVPHVEKSADDKTILQSIQIYWNETIMAMPNMDILLLACTHYPILMDQIRKVVPEKVKVVEQGDFVGPKWSDYLKRHPEHESLLSKPNQGSVRYLTTGDTALFNEKASAFLGHSVNSQPI